MLTPANDYGKRLGGKSAIWPKGFWNESAIAGFFISENQIAECHRS
jgi:hypothetical protein